MGIPAGLWSENNEAFWHYDGTLPPAALSRHVNFFQHDLGALGWEIKNKALEKLLKI